MLGRRKAGRIHVCVKKKESGIFMRRIKKLARLECPTSVLGRKKKEKVMIRWN